MSDLLISSEVREQGAVSINLPKPYQLAVAANSISIIGRAVDVMAASARRKISEAGMAKMRAKAICAEAWETEITKLFSESYEVDSRQKHNNYLAFWGV